MKSPQTKVFGFLCVLCVLCGESLCYSLDREAFSITNYDLNLQIEPEQHRLGARGKITLRNDTGTPQKIAVLQISSSLDWRAIRSGDKMLQFVKQPYTSDIDHTGSLSEAIVTLPQEMAPHAAIDLDIAYEGVIVLDTSRLTRIGTPEETATNSDWDTIDEKFTGIRGAGYVAWYPIITDVANLSEANSFFDVLARWRQRESESHMKVSFGGSIFAADGATPTMLCSGKGSQGVTREGTAKLPWAECSFDAAAISTPSFAIAPYGVVRRPSTSVYNLASHAVAAEGYADASERVAAFISDWFGPQRESPKTGDLPDPNAAPFESGALLLTPLADSNSKLAGLVAAHQLTHASLQSSRPWINEGLAHFAQALFLEQQKGRQAALDYIGTHRSVLTGIEALPRPEDEASRSLVSTTNEELYRSKAMCVWWMLRDMIGDPALKKAIAAYRSEDDKDPTYMQHLVTAETSRDLEWFFDDWVYHDRGLPDFKIESAFASKTPTNGFMLTITLDNLGTAGAEVPVNIKLASGEITKRIELRAKSKITFRVETPTAPQEIRVNDGSVPESNPGNNVFKVDPPKS
jgi:hypothetical protein